MSLRLASVVPFVLLLGSVASSSVALESPHRWRIGISVRGDDGLTQKFQVALEAAIRRSEDFTDTFSANVPFDATMAIPNHVGWVETKKGTRIFAVVIFIGPGGRYLGASTPECFEASMSDCAERVLADARPVFRVLNGA
jgi:hypothetical protein